MSHSKKMRVMGLLGACGLATAFSLYRLVLVLKEGSTPDQTILFMCHFVRVCLHLCPSSEQDLTLARNAEGGVGLICACLPVLNSLLAHYQRSYLSQKYYTQSSDAQLGYRKSGNNSRSASRWEPPTPFNDQIHLISFVGTPYATRSAHTEDGIRKTVALEQTVDSAGSADSASADGASR